MTPGSQLTERQAEALDHDHSICVTAGAGTGKTMVLVEKYVDLLAKRPELAVPNILAMTFTEKAAAEMKTRIRDRIREMKGQRWEEVREDLPFAEISTIHSLCARIVRRFPIEASVTPGFEILDEQGADELRIEAWDDLLYLQSPGSAPDALARVLAVLDQKGTRDAVLRLLERRRASERFFKSLDAEDASLIATWNDMAEERQREIISSMLRDETYAVSVKALADLAERYVGTEDMGMLYLLATKHILSQLSASKQVKEQVQLLVELGKAKGSKSMGSKKNWEEADLLLLRQSYVNLRSKLEIVVPILDLGTDDTEFMELTLRFLRDLATVFARYCEVYDELKRENGVLGFDDLLVTALRLLEECPAASEYFSKRYRYVLVDEFQDTDPVQFEIVWRIIGQVSERCERLFVVGDPKQSIYLFRDADVTLFKETMGLILRELKGKTLYLDVNFRSVPEIVEFVNHLFSGLFASIEKPWEFKYERIETSKARVEDRGTVELLLTLPPGRDERAACSEALAVADRLLNMVKVREREVYWEGKDHLPSPRPCRYGDIAILLRRRTNLRYYEWALARRGIPYHVHGGQGFYEGQEVKDVYNLLSFLENERDDAALYGTLRSPYFGVSDAHLYRSCNQPGATLWRKLRTYAEGAEDPSVGFAAENLRRWLTSAHSVTVSELINMVLRESGVFAVYGAMEDGEQAMANIEKLTAMARNAGGGRRSSLTDFLSLLQTLINETPREGEAQLDVESGDNVKIMTIHSAKGLEFPIVVVPDLGANPKESEDPVLVDERYGVGLRLPRESKGFQMSDTLHRSLILPELRDKSAAEEKRLFYVACTRARDHLVLAGTRPVDIAKSIADPKSRMDWLFSRLRIGEEHVSEGASRIAVQGGRPKQVNLQISFGSADVWARGPALRRERLDDLDHAYRPVSLPVPVRPITVAEDVRLYSPTELEEYIRCPLRYREFRVVGVTNGPSVESSGSISALTRGRCVHEMLAGRPIGPTAMLLGLHGHSEVESLAGLTRIFMDSELMADVVEDYRELPFKAKVGGVWFKGRIDRLIRKTDGSWVIIDYKSDDVSADEVMVAAKDYALQLFVYEKAIEQIVKAEVRSYCYFTGPSVSRMRTGGDAQMVNLISEIASRISDGVFSYPQCSECRRRAVPFGLRGTCPGLTRAWQGMG